jgi:GxxExxY protein
MSEILYKTESYDIIGSCFNVYNNIGHGFLEPIYQEALELEFDEQLVPFESQKELDIYYCGTLLKKKYIPDFICHGKIIVEIKSVKVLMPEHEAQLFNYLRITGLKLGILVNFGTYPKIEYKRVVCNTNL